MKIKQDLLEQFDFAGGDYVDKVARRYEARIGRFLMRFSELEHNLDIAIVEGVLDRAHSLGYLVIEGHTLNTKIELFRKLYQAYTKAVVPSRMKKLRGLVKRLHEARVFRNYVAHANWRTLERSGYVRTRVGEKEGDVVFKKVRITPSSLEAWHRRIVRLDELLDEFIDGQ